MRRWQSSPSIRYYSISCAFAIQETVTRSYDRGRRGGRRPFSSGESGGLEEGLSVEEVVRILQQLPKGQQIPEHVSFTSGIFPRFRC